VVHILEYQDHRLLQYSAVVFSSYGTYSKGGRGEGYSSGYGVSMAS
jgi:hypothetical protein